MADAIVVGGGPAGATAALLLARQGRRVVLVERTDFPRPKPCGDCLSAAATGLLEDLGLLQAVLDAGAARIHHWRIRSPAGHVCRGGFGAATALALERRALDAVLLQAAVNAGATLVRGRVRDLLRDRESGLVTGVTLRKVAAADGELRAPLVVGADGLRSVVARRAGLVRRRPRLRKVSLTTHGAGPAGDLAHGEMHVLDGGCFGLAPAGAGRFNLTLVVADRHAGALGALGPGPFFHRWLDRAPAVRARLDGAVLDDGFLASGPFDWPTRAAVAPGLALVGDAAGYYDPFTGQGVYHAMAGARRLAHALAGVDVGSPGAVRAALRRYAREARRLKRPAHLLQRLIEGALAPAGRADRVLRRLTRAPALVDALVEVTGDLRHPATLLSPRLLSTFVFPLSPEVR